MKNKVVLVLIPLLLTSCNLLPTNKKSNSSISSNEEQSSQNTSLTTQASTIDTKSSNTKTSESGSSSKPDVVGGKLPCGYDMLDKPSNTPITIKTSTSVDDWYTQDITDEDVDGYRYIYGNNATKGQFFDYDESDVAQYPGGYRMNEKGRGFQSAMFSHSGAKLEIRVGISQLTNSSKEPDKGKPTAFWYFYDKDGNFLKDLAQELDEGSIVTGTEFVRCYVTQKAEQVAYFEFRVNALPYKSKQSYNFGIGYVSIHSWTYA